MLSQHVATVEEGWPRRTICCDALALVPTHRVQSLAGAIRFLRALALDCALPFRHSLAVRGD